jgi:hypothetical protein
MANLNLSGSLGDASASVSQAKEELINLTTAMKEAVKQATSFAATAEVIKERSTGTKNAMSDTLSIMAKQGNERLKEKDIDARINENTTRSLSAQAQLREAIKKSQTFIGINSQEDLDANNAIIDALSTQIQQEEEIATALTTVLNNLNKNNAAVDAMENKTKSIAKLFRSLSRIPIIGPLLPIHAATAAIEKAQQNGKKGLDLYIAGVQGMGKEMKASMGWVLGIAAAVKIISVAFDMIKSAVKHFFELDKTLTKISNNIGLSQKGMAVLTASFKDTAESGEKISKSLDVAFLSVTNQANAMLELQDAFGTTSMFSKETLENQILLTKQMGLEADEAAGLQKIALLNGKSAEALLNTITKTNISNVSNRKVIAEIAKLNAEITASYKNNPELIASAVVQAQKLGLTMEQTRKISDSLLEFESSISNELEAELLSGKQLNFEKARALALDGKSSEAAGELMREMGGLNALTNMNVIVRGGMAKSIGMTSEELMKAAHQQEILNNLGVKNENILRERYNQLVSIGKRDEAEALMSEVKKQKGGELLAQDISRASIAARFEESMLRIKDIFATQLAGPIMGISNFLAGILKNTTMLKIAFVGLVTLATAFAAAMTAAAIAMAFASGGATLATAALVAGGIAGIGAIAAVSDSAISPDGQIMISTPKGMIKPDPNDSIITTTDPGSLLSGGGGSSAGVEARLDKMLAYMQRPGIVQIDSVRSGTAQGMSYNSYV